MCDCIFVLCFQIKDPKECEISQTETDFFEFLVRQLLLPFCIAYNICIV